MQKDQKVKIILGKCEANLGYRRLSKEKGRKEKKSKKEEKQAS